MTSIPGSNVEYHQIGIVKTVSNEATKMPDKVEI